MQTLRAWRAGVPHRRGMRVSEPGLPIRALSWIGEERIAIGGVPPAGSVAEMELSAVSALLFPRVMSRRTSVSRGVRSASSGSGRHRRGRLVAGLSADARDAG